MTKKILCLFLTAALVAGSLCACAKQNRAGDGTAGRTPVVLNEVAHSIFYAPMYVAIEEGYFAEEGIDLKLVTGFGADKTMTALLSGEADIKCERVAKQPNEAKLRSRPSPPRRRGLRIVRDGFSFEKSSPHSLRRSSFSAKSHAQVACSVVNALATALFRYQLFAGFAPPAHC